MDGDSGGGHDHHYPKRDKKSRSATTLHFHNFYYKYKDAILFNKNLLIADTCSLFVSSLFAEVYFKLVNSSYIADSIFTALVEYGIDTPIFFVLYYIDNRHRYIIQDENDTNLIGRKKKKDTLKIRKRMKIVFNDPTFSSQLLRAIGEAYYRGAEIGECLSTAYRIKEGNFESWHTEWLKTAKRIHSYANESFAKGHNMSARDAYLRASNYYRVAEFLLVDPHDPRIQTTWGNSKECFSKAAALFPFYVESIEIPYGEGVTLPGYFYHYSKKDSVYKNGDGNTRGKETEMKVSRPTLIAHGGFDSTLEELYSSAAAPALERGYNCLTFEGPGQGGVIRKQEIPFRHDWEKVVTPVIDYAINRKEEFGIDVNRIALMGMSMGGYLAARAAAFDHRISACILNDGVYDGYDALRSSFPESLLTALEEGNSEFVNSTITDLMESDPNARFNMKHGMWTTGSNSPYGLITGAKSHTIKDIIKNITCPTLVLEAEKDDSFPGQPKKVYDGLRSPKKYILFTEEEGAEEHCQSGASALSNQRIFDWVDEVFEYKPMS